MESAFMCEPTLRGYSDQRRACFSAADITWQLGDTLLHEVDRIKYVGVPMSYRKPHGHVSARISSCRKAFYGLQGAGLCNTVTDPDTASYVWSTAIRPVLTNGLNTVNVDKTRLKELGSIQGKLVKSMVSLHKYCRSTPLLKAMKIPSVESLLDVSNIELLRHVLTNDSRARSFYFHCLNIVVCDRSSSQKGYYLIELRTFV